MSIEEIQEKIKTSLMYRHSRERLVFSGILVLVAVICFELGGMRSGEVEGSAGRLPAAAALLDTELTKEMSKKPPSTSTLDARPQSLTPTTTETYVASKNGTKFHLPWCTGARRISVENKLIFNSREEAMAAGLTPAANCPGLN